MRLISSRDAYAQPLDWTRSRVRREHLISMGVPVNLDEVCPIIFYLSFILSSPTLRLMSFSKDKAAGS
jgi:hypothetical protein